MDLLEVCLPQIRTTLARFRIPPSDRDDLVQDAALALLRNESCIENPQAWLIGCLRHKCLHYWRARRRQVYDSVDSGILEAIDRRSAASPDRGVIEGELRAALKRIDTRCQKMLQLRYFMDCDTKQVAEQLGYRTTSVGKVSSRCLGALVRAFHDPARVKP